MHEPFGLLTVDGHLCSIIHPIQCTMGTAVVACLITKTSCIIRTPLYILLMDASDLSLRACGDPQAPMKPTDGVHSR